MTTHDPKLQRGLVISDKAVRVANYAKNMDHEFRELLSSMGVKHVRELTPDMIYEPDINSTTARCKG